MLNKKNKGITLVALVITIIILLILAGISISALTNTGIFQKTKDAKQKSEDAELDQNTKLDEYENEIDKYLPKKDNNKTVSDAIKEGKDNKPLSTDKNTELTDEKGNKVVVPAGFKVTEDATTVDQGIVIEDVTSGATAGSQFVWIPVGTITKADGTQVVINLNRYTFANDDNGTPTAQNENIVENYYQEVETSNKANTLAKSISNFKSSVEENGGYYIGRYEARTTTARSDKGDDLTQITEKGTDQVYNYVTQIQAASQAQNMYDDTHTFTCDLINSYAWDTATLFLQTCGENKYSRKLSVNNDIASKGTNETDYTKNRDKVCNVYDMASNVSEWTTESTYGSYSPCVVRGGFYRGNTIFYTSSRFGNEAFDSYEFVGFRPLLYL